MKIKHILGEFAKRKGIIAGVCNANVLSRLESIVMSSETPFVSTSVNKRLNPAASLKTVESIVVIGVNYGKKYDFILDDAGRGIISTYAAQADYHILLREMLNELVLDINQVLGSFEHKILIDSGGLVEKELAVKAGLGYYGKNSLVISEEFGSLFFIGCLLTDIHIDESELSVPLYECCDSCMKCVDACPSGALEDSKFDYKKCISYITQKKGKLSVEESKLIGNHLYGCDICQVACPHNENKPYAFIKNIDLVMPKISDIVNISDEDFERRFGNTVIKWAGVEVLKRNAAVIRGINCKFQGENYK